MSSPSDAATPFLETSKAAPLPPKRLREWLREPLLHFVALGGVLFALDHFVAARTHHPRTIVVDAAQDREAIETFKASRGHAPNPEELAALRQVYLDNEVLYREGLALEVDKGDAAIRERVIFKALSVIDSNVKLPPVDEATLRQWFDGHRKKYDEPAHYDFDEAVLSGDDSEAAVRAFVKDLNAGTPGDAKAGLRVFKNRPLANLVQAYGAELTQALTHAAPGNWVALHTNDGWRAMRLNAAYAAKEADFKALRGVVLQDWTDANASEQRTAAVRALAKKYVIEYETAKPQHGDAVKAEADE
ncbi:MAG TPA: peptidylprolyl isomerase [Polyangiaceae bacterium]|nr:peptidylprolyl isomerase [Polyangiaceae bacterium]